MIPRPLSAGEAVHEFALNALSRAIGIFETAEETAEARTLLKQSIILAASCGALGDAEAARLIQSLGLAGD